jgi:hypothetical protein
MNSEVQGCHMHGGHQGQLLQGTTVDVSAAAACAVHLWHNHPSGMVLILCSYSVPCVLAGMGCRSSRTSSTCAWASTTAHEHNTSSEKDVTTRLCGPSTAGGLDRMSAYVLNWSRSGKSPLSCIHACSSYLLQHYQRNRAQQSRQGLVAQLCQQHTDTWRVRACLPAEQWLALQAECFGAAAH